MYYKAGPTGRQAKAAGLGLNLNWLWLIDLEQSSPNAQKLDHSS